MDRATEGVRQEFLRKGTDELLVMAHQERPQIRRAVKRGAAGHSPRRIDGSTSLARGAPRPDRIEMFEREAQRVHRRVTHRTDGILPVGLKPFTHRGGPAGSALILQARYVGGRRRRGQAEDVVEQPLAPQHR